MHQEPEKVAIAGDWHGNARWAKNTIERAHEEGADALIQVGDFGYWTKQTRGAYLDMVQGAVKKTGIWLGWLPGNHEAWTELPEAGRGKTPSLIGNTVFLPIGYRWKWWDKNFMALGGAFSIDRFMRKEGVSYWAEECLTNDDVTWATHQPHGMDVIFAHDCPTGVEIPGIGTEGKPRGGKNVWPPLMMAGAEAHRRMVKQVWDKHRPQLWYHGHYHIPYSSFYGPTVFHGLDMDGTTFSQNVKYLMPDDLK